MNRTAPATILAVAALLSGTAALATSRPHAPHHRTGKIVTVTKTHVVSRN